jgi:hypothetical protein
MLAHDNFLSLLKVLNSLLFFCSEIDLPLSTSCLEKEVNFSAKRRSEEEGKENKKEDVLENKT